MIETSRFPSLWSGTSEPLRHLTSKLHDWFAPASEAGSNDEAYVISLELPGVAEEDIEITHDAGVLTIKGQKKTSREEKGETYFFSERSFGSFSRSFRLPDDVDAGRINAKLEAGVLSVSVPRKEKQTTSHRIKIGTS